MLQMAGGCPHPARGIRQAVGSEEGGRSGAHVSETPTTPPPTRTGPLPPVRIKEGEAQAPGAGRVLSGTEAEDRHGDKGVCGPSANHSAVFIGLVSF